MAYLIRLFKNSADKQLTTFFSILKHYLNYNITLISIF